jgi:hypothetical protein
VRTDQIIDFTPENSKQRIAVAVAGMLKCPVFGRGLSFGAPRALKRQGAAIADGVWEHR